VDETKLVYLDFAPGKYQSQYVEHRDFKVYGDYLYGVCDEGTSSLQIFDLSYLPDSVSKVYDNDAFFQICHNIYIDTAKARLYASGPNNSGLQIFDISNPTDPQLELYFTDLDYVHDCYVRNDTAFLNAGFDGLYVYDFSGPVPIQLGIIDFYPNQGYNHSGWLSPSKNQYVFIDETEGTRIKLCEWDESLSTISITETFGTRNYQDYVPHNVILLENLAFISYYNEGFRIYDIRKGPIQEIGAYDTYPDESIYKLNGAWGVYVFEDENQILIADRQYGLFLFSFPINVFNADKDGTYITSTPFIDQNSFIVPRDYLDEEGLSFSIFGADGSVVYFQENFLSYANIPLDLAAGTYIYSIYDEFGKFIESGKFVKAN
jgi:choice-of-anchor B domain-containing protein